MADLVLALHFLFVLFVLGGFFGILAGAFLGWGWVRHRGFRLAHLGAIVFVAGESLLGFACPLTLWENALRRTGADERSFVGHWIARLLYYDFPEWAFALAYAVFALAVAALWRLVPPAPRGTSAARR